MPIIFFTQINKKTLKERFFLNISKKDSLEKELKNLFKKKSDSLLNEVIPEQCRFFQSDH
jgi:hypothetical protein